MTLIPHINVLMADDSRISVLVVEKQLSGEIVEGVPLRFVAAKSGEEALQRLEEQDFALILLDVQMPGMDGYAVAERMRAAEKTRDIAIIFITAEDKEEERKFVGYEAGAVDYLVKPFDAAILRDRVRTLCKEYLLRMGRHEGAGGR